MNSPIIKKKEEIHVNLFNNQYYQTPTYIMDNSSINVLYEHDTPFFTFIEKLNKEIHAEYFKKEKQIKLIESFIGFLTSKFDNIIDMITIDDPEKKVSKIFVLKIPKSVSPEERMEIKSNIIDECVEYCEKNGLMDALIDTAIFVRR